MIVNKYQGQGGGSGSGYTLPTATETRLGGVKIGSGVSVAADGTISVSGGTGGITAYYFNEMTQAELAALYTLLETEAGRPDTEGVLSANTINEKYAFFNDFANPATVPPDMEYIRLQFYGFYYGRAVFVQTLTKADGADGVNNYLIWLQSNGTFERMERSQRDFPTKGTQTVGYFDDSSNYIVYNKGNNTFTDKDGNTLSNGGGFGGSLYWFVMHPIQGDWGNGIATVPFKVIDANSAETMHYYASVEMETLAAPITIDGVEYTERFAFKYPGFTFGGYVNGTPQYASLTFKEESEIAIIDFINDLSSNINKVGKKIEEAYNDNKQIFLRGKDTYNSGYTLLPFYQYITYGGNPRYIFKGSSISNNNSGECIYYVYAQKSVATGNWSLSGVSGSHFNAVHTTTPIWQGTQAEYNALGTYDPNTLYVIKNS